ncbi:MAG: DUF1552 domain-containing protein [Myxococcota bacterium]
MRTQSRISRRRLLQGLGASAAVLPFLPQLESVAGLTPAPRRFVVFFTPHGTIKENWQPTRDNGDFSLSPILAPLAAHKEQLTVIEGLNIVPEGEPNFGTHTVGPAYVSTGSAMAPGSFYHMSDPNNPTHGWSSTPSIDQSIAEQIGLQSAFKSLQFGVHGGGAHPGSVISYAGPNQPLIPQSRPDQMFETVFGEAGLDPSIAAKRKADRLSVLDVIKPELHQVQARISAADRLKVDAHIEGVRQIEQRLSFEYDCEAPALGEFYPVQDMDHMEEIADQQSELMVTALACQATNVASYMVRRGENDSAPYLHLGIEDAHHSLSHSSAPEDRETMSQIYTWYASVLADIADRLAAVPEQDGTALDNTLILWCSEVAAGNTHSWDDMPFVLLGGKNIIRGDQYLSYSGERHNMLLTALGQAMGLDITSYGSFDDGAGALTDILI